MRAPGMWMRDRSAITAILTYTAACTRPSRRSTSTSPRRGRARRTGCATAATAMTATTASSRTCCANSAMRWATARAIWRIISRASSVMTAWPAASSGSGATMRSTVARTRPASASTRTAAIRASTRISAISAWTAWCTRTARRIPGCWSSRTCIGRCA